MNTPCVPAIRFGGRAFPSQFGQRRESYVSSVEDGYRQEVDNREIDIKEANKPEDVAYVDFG